MNVHGSKWIRPKKRERIYARDGWCCGYCDKHLRDEVASNRTLDHIQPRSMGGSNEATNLITACLSCNSSRKDTDLPEHVWVKVTTLAAMPI